MTARILKNLAKNRKAFGLLVFISSFVHGNFFACFKAKNLLSSDAKFVRRFRLERKTLTFLQS